MGFHGLLEFGSAEGGGIVALGQQPVVLDLGDSAQERRGEVSVAVFEKLFVNLYLVLSGYRATMADSRKVWLERASLMKFRGPAFLLSRL